MLGKSSAQAPKYGTLHDLDKYRRATINATGRNAPIGHSKIVGTSAAGMEKYRRDGKQMRVGLGLFAAAQSLARNNANIAFQTSADGLTGILYELQVKGAQSTAYEDVEDGFTERRTNYDETAVTLQALAEQVKTLKRDLMRKGIL